MWLNHPIRILLWEISSLALQSRVSSAIVLSGKSFSPSWDKKPSKNPHMTRFQGQMRSHCNRNHEKGAHYKNCFWKMIKTSEEDISNFCPWELQTILLMGVEIPKFWIQNLNSTSCNFRTRRNFPNRLD